jgi:hypothetical protein
MSDSPNALLLKAAFDADAEFLAGHIHYADTCCKIAIDAVGAVMDVVNGPLSVQARIAGVSRIDLDATAAHAVARATGKSPK